MSRTGIGTEFQVCFTPPDGREDGWTGALFAALLEGMLSARPELAEAEARALCGLAGDGPARHPAAERMGYVLDDRAPDRTAIEALADYLGAGRRREGDASS
ncbi:hypothetical protein [Azospirillum thermophilum]|uniref:Uncharacterized protein n=1 Tax=Azospirillum thermophilum TaxID=2202148 RepID=A0A2S2CUB9_9PROT|nr:hypothetical protein [Azospirillum thermophilum]AWK88101.1 hypothetical protein DEW08_18400 [Azospirillum thermophilum]